MLKHLFSPIKIGSMVLPNRIIMPAVTTNYNRESDERAANFYGEIAKGGTTLIIIGGLQAIFPGRREVGGMTVNKDEDIPHLQKLTRAVHDNGGKAAAQLAIWNFWAKNGIAAEAEDVSPSGVVTMSQLAQWSKTQFVSKTRTLTIEEISMIEEEVARAAVRAAESGFDCVEVQAIAGNLVHRFINPHTNQRTDAYGGSMENRLRILLEIIALIKKQLGNDFPCICRIAGEDLVPWGQNLDDYKKMAPVIEKSGVHALNIMPGWYETRQPRHQMSVPRGAFVYLAEGIKQVVKIPVAAGNRLTEPKMAEQILADGKADLLAMCRTVVADPEFPNKAKAGKLDEIRMCTACCQCWDDIAAGKDMTCSVNARLGREGELAITPAPKSKKVFVIGGGPGGLEAARVAALRGHKVTLFEKSDKLGGQLLVASIPPHKDEWLTTIDYFRTQMKKLGVAVKLNHEVTAKTLEQGKPDAVILATGAVPIVPRIPGVEGNNVALAGDVLLGKKSVGRKVVIVGGGLVGCETAEFLFKAGKKVTILEMLPAVASDVGAWSRWPLLDRLSEAGVRIEVNEKVEKITEKGVLAIREGKTELFEADSVVLAAGMKANDSLGAEIAGKFPSPVRVGTCFKPGKVVNAIADGFMAGLNI